MIAEVGPRPAIVVATPGAEPWPSEGYAAVVLLDVQALMAVPGLRAAEQAARRWFNAAALARPGAPVVITARNDMPATQALIRWAPGWFAQRELAQRRDAGMPPAQRSAEVVGPAAEIEALAVTAPAAVTVLGPVAVEQPSRETHVAAGKLEASSTAKHRRLLLLTSPRDASAMTEWLRSETVTRSAERRPSLTVRIDPVDLT